MANHSSDTQENSNGLVVGSAVGLIGSLWLFTDPLAALVGTILIGATYASYYSPKRV